MNPKFIKYEVNETPMSQRGQYEPLGIATVALFDGAVVLRYIIKAGKEGRGYFITEFSQKLNGEWHKSSTIDSNIAKEEIESIIKKGILASSKPVQEVPKQAPQKTYMQPSFSEEEVPF